MIERKTARVLLLNEEDELLLIQYQDARVKNPLNPFNLPFWVTPGGKIEEGENFEYALRREIWEETGILNVVIQELLWSQNHKLQIESDVYDFHENFYKGFITKQVISRTFLTENEKVILKNYKWWSFEEIINSSELFFPEHFSELVDLTFIQKRRGNVININNYF